MKKRMKHDRLTIFVLFYVIFTSTTGCLCGMFTEYGVLLFQIWHLISAAIWFGFAIMAVVLFHRLSCLNKLKIEIQRLEKEIND